MVSGGTLAASEERGAAMDSSDVDRPIMTDLDGDNAADEKTTPLQPWLRRFASVVGFASAGTAPGGSQALS